MVLVSIEPKCWRRFLPNWQALQKQKFWVLLIPADALQCFVTVLRVCKARWLSLWWSKLTSTSKTVVDIVAWLFWQTKYSKWIEAELDTVGTWRLEVAKIDNGLLK